MAQQNLLITDKQIPLWACTRAITIVRDTQTNWLSLKFTTNRTRASWRIKVGNSWLTVAKWPEVKTKDIRRNLPILMEKAMNNQEVKFSEDCFVTVGHLLTWYGNRIAENANLSDQRKKDVKSKLKCHLMPCLAELDISKITPSVLDDLLVWPLQKELSKGSVAKVFQTLKSAFNDACDLRKLTSNPITQIKISDFGDFSEDVKESKLKPRMVPWFLDELEEQHPMVKMICMIMLTTGTRIGETILAKWKDLDLVNELVWDIPTIDTKTKKAHSINLPKPLVTLLIEWKGFLKSRHQLGKYLFPGNQENTSIHYNDICALVHSFSAGEWSSHDLRKCARICWTNQGVDSMVAERLLNHGLGKVAEAYLDGMIDKRIEALTNHSTWLIKQNKNCYLLSPNSVQVKINNTQEFSKNNT